MVLGEDGVGKSSFIEHCFVSLVLLEDGMGKSSCVLVSVVAEAAQF